MPVYYAPILLDPRLKMHWFRSAWADREATAPWVPQTEERVRSIWRTQYKVTNTTNLASQSSISRSIGETMYDRLTSSKRLILDPSAAAVQLDQFDQYLATDPVVADKSFSVIQYWIDRRLTQPQLAQFALDTFAIPLMTDDNERSFSSGRDMITYRRSRLLDDIIEHCQCLKGWLKAPARAAFDENPQKPQKEPAAVPDEQRSEEQPPS